MGDKLHATGSAVLMIAVVALIVLHTLDGREIVINPRHVTSMREAKDDDADSKAFAPGVRCMVNTSDGKFVTVIEPCPVVQQMIEGAR